MTYRRLFLFLLVLAVAGCATSPPGADAPRTASRAWSQPGETRLGRATAPAVRAHPDTSGFRLLSVGADGFVTRMQLADAAERTLDVQYFILRSDASGRSFTDALLRAADRGVRVRILIDDGETKPGDERVGLLAAHPHVEVRVFNPFAYRGHVPLLRAAEFLANAGRLDYRMHNKLFVADNAVALVGGRNVADEYFQVDPGTQFADDDVFATGPVVQQLSNTFDAFWNAPSSIPIEALDRRTSSPDALAAYRSQLEAQREERLPDGVDYRPRIASGEPLASMTDGRLPLVWATWTVVCDSPDKKDIEKGWRVGALMEKPVAEATTAVNTELLMITPYLVPGDDGMKLLDGLRDRGVAVRILTNSLESSTVAPAQAGYMRYRRALLDRGVDLFEVRSMLESTRGSGQTAAISRFGNYSLHGKMFVFDRRRIFVGSMNFDQRSMHLNTEIGLLIDSPVLAGQLAERFHAMTAPEAAYRVGHDGHRLSWTTVAGGAPIRYDDEPAKTPWQKLEVEVLQHLPLDREL